MAIVYTTSWEGEGSDSYDSREFSRIATVISNAGEVLTPVNVKTATHETSSAPLPKVGDQSDLDTRYYVQSVRPRILGPHIASVGISYKLGKGSGEQENEDPLTNPVRYRIRNGINGEPTDADVDGNPLLNSAGEPFSGTVQTEIAAIYIDIIRNEPSYNLPQAIAYTNRVNADVFTLAGYPINPGEAYCLGIQPEGDFKLDDTYVPVVYSFEIRDRLTLQNGGRETAFIHRIMDKGRRGWANTPGGGGDSVRLVEIAVDNGLGQDPSPVSSDVQLDGNGQPLDKTSYIGIDAQFEEWIAPDAEKAPNATRDLVAATSTTFLLYNKHFTANMGNLGLP